MIREYNVHGMNYGSSIDSDSQKLWLIHNLYGAHACHFTHDMASDSWLTASGALA